MHTDTRAYNRRLSATDRKIAALLSRTIDAELEDAENRVWHAHPVWFLDGNPIVGYSRLKDCVRLMFWSGQSFKTKGLSKEGSFKAAEARYRNVDDVNVELLTAWLREARDVQWDYKNIVKRRGKLVRIRTTARRA